MEWHITWRYGWGSSLPKVAVKELGYSEGRVCCLSRGAVNAKVCTVYVTESLSCLSATIVFCIRCSSFAYYFVFSGTYSRKSSNNYRLGAELAQTVHKYPQGAVWWKRIYPLVESHRKLEAYKTHFEKNNVKEMNSIEKWMWLPDNFLQDNSLPDNSLDFS